MRISDWSSDVCSSDRAPVAIHVGRIAAEKNLPLAVRAFRELQRARPDARFAWVGDGPAREQLQREHPDFIFCGVQRGEALARHFASAEDRKSTRLNPVTNAHLVCRLLLEKKK